LAYWEGACDGAIVPSRSAIDPKLLREWLGDVSIIEFHEGDKNFYIKLHGMNVAKNIGDYYARGYLEDNIPPDAQQLIFEPYFAARRTKRPVYSVIRPGALKGSFAKFERLILPFANCKNREIEHFLAWVGPTERDRVDCESIYEEPLSSFSSVFSRDKGSEIFVFQRSSALAS